MNIFIKYTGCIIGILSITLIIIAGPGSRMGLYPFSAGIAMMMAGGFTGIAAVIVSIITLMSGNQNIPHAITGLIAGALSSGIIVFLGFHARNAPAIHDISTDTVNPPQFVSLTALRKNAVNTAEYGGKEIAGKQLSAYPDIRTIRLGLGKDAAFKKSFETARALGWEIVDENLTAGRIEAVDTTLMFGFKDDIVIRILPGDKGSTVDIRSLSRVGRGDLGTNAKRIRKFMSLLDN